MVLHCSEVLPYDLYGPSMAYNVTMATSIIYNLLPFELMKK